MRSAQPDASVLPSQAQVRQCFQQLKPICVKIMEEQTKIRIHFTNQSTSHSSPSDDYSQLYQCLCELKSTIEIMPPDSLMGCLDYVLFPLTQLLSQYKPNQPNSRPAKHRESCYIVTLNVLSALFQLASQTSLRSSAESDLALIASKVIADARGFSAMVQIITHPFPPNSSTAQSSQDVSDEFQYACLQALSGILSAASSQIMLFLSFNKAIDDPSDRINHSFVNFIYSPSFHIAAGFVVSVCLSIIRSSKHRQSRAEACHAIDCLLDCLDQTSQGRAMVASYLPGVVSTLYAVLNNASVNLLSTTSVNQSTGRIVQVSCISLLTRFIDCVMTDDYVLATLAKLQEKAASKAASVPIEHQSPSEKPDESCSALMQLTQLQQMIKLANRTPDQQQAISEYDRFGWDTSKGSSGSSVPPQDLLVERNEKWLAETIARLSQCLIDIFNAPFLGACHPAVTCAFVASSAQFIMRCARLFPSCLIDWLEFIVGSTQNSESLDVQNLAQEKLRTIRASGLTVSPSTLPALYERLREHLLSLPRVLRSASPQYALKLMHVITGYIQLLGDADESLEDSTDQQSTWLFDFLSSHQNFPELFHCLANALTIDMHDVHVVERAASDLKTSSTDYKRLSADDVVEDPDAKTTHSSSEVLAADQHDHQTVDAPNSLLVSSDPIPNHQESIQYQVRFTYASSDDLRSAVLAIPFEIGRCTGVKVGELLDALLSFLPDEQSSNSHFHSASQSAGPVLVIINSIIRGIRARFSLNRVDQELDHFANQSIAPYLELAFEAYLASSCMQLPVFDYRTQSEIRSNALVRALVLRGLSEIIDCLIDCGIDQSIHMLVKDSLFQVICALGSPSVLVSSAAMVTLTSMARLGNRSLDRPDVGPFIMQNSDYVVDQIAAHLRADEFDQTRGDSINQSINRERAWTLPHLLSALLDSPQPMIPVVGLSDVLSLIIDKLNSTLISSDDANVIQSLDRSDVDMVDANEEWRCAYLQSLVSLTRAIRRHFHEHPPPQHPSTSQSIYQSTPTITFDQLLVEHSDEHADYYSATNIVARLKAKRAEWKSTLEPDTPSADKETPEEWYRKMEAKRKMREQLEEIGLDPSALDDDEEKEAKRKHEEWQKKDREDEQATATVEQAAVMSIFKQARFYLACRSLRELRLVLAIIENSIHCLVDIPKELYPLIAQLWPSFVLVLKQQRAVNQSLTDSNIAASHSHQSKEALITALSVLECLCSHTSRFIASRFHKEAWPHLKQVLIDESSALASSQELNEKAAAESVQSKVLISVLRSLSSLLQWPDLMQGHVRDIVCQLARFLDRSLPESIQSQAKKVILQCAAMDRDVTSWALLKQVQNEQQASVHSINSNESVVKALDWDYITETGLDRDGRLIVDHKRAIADYQSRYEFFHSKTLHHTGPYAQNVIELQHQINLMKETRRM